MVEKLAHFVYVIDEIKEACGDAYEKEKPRNNCPSARGLRLHNTCAILQFFAWKGVVGFVPEPNL